MSLLVEVSVRLRFEQLLRVDPCPQILLWNSSILVLLLQLEVGSDVGGHDVGRSVAVWDDLHYLLLPG